MGFEKNLSGLVVDESKLISQAIEQKVPEKIAFNAVNNFMEFKIFGIPMKYIIFSSTAVLIWYRLSR